MRGMVGGGPIEHDLERRRTWGGGRQLHDSGGDGRRSMTCEAVEAHEEAEGWGPATVPRFQYRFKPGKLIQTRSNILEKFKFDLIQNRLS
jgi:hypothetical protein